MSSRLQTAWAVLAALALVAAQTGCQEEEQKKADVKIGPAKTVHVSPEERAWADQQVRALWSDPQVRRRIGALKPAPAAMGFCRDLVVLTRHPHRLAGWGRHTTAEVGPKTLRVYEDLPGSLAAGQYVANRLKSMGVELVLTQEFRVPHCRQVECRLVADGKTYEKGVYVMRPNNLQGVCTPTEGLTGKTVYAGGGERQEYRADPDGRIVILDFAAGDRWQAAFAMGAKAVVFIGQDAPAPMPLHHVNSPANLPRFYVNAELAEALKLKTASAEITLHAASRWEMLTGRNVFGVIRGSDATFPKDAKDTDALAEAILLSAPLDSLSEVPELSPGARNAANCAALLGLAEAIVKDPPRRDVIVAFFDGDAANHAGARAMYGELFRDKDKGKNAKTLFDRLVMFQAERLFVDGIHEVVATDDIVTLRDDELRRHMEQRVAALDRDGDGKLNALELAGERGRMPTPAAIAQTRPAAPPVPEPSADDVAQAKARIEQWDKGKDGALDAAELTDEWRDYYGLDQRMARRIKQWDRDGDGALDAAELAIERAHVLALPAPGPTSRPQAGPYKPSPAEVRCQNARVQEWDKQDDGEKGHGALDREELAAERKYYRREALLLMRDEAKGKTGGWRDVLQLLRVERLFRFRDFSKLGGRPGDIWSVIRSEGKFLRAYREKFGQEPPIARPPEGGLPALKRPDFEERVRQVEAARVKADAKARAEAQAESRPYPDDTETPEARDRRLRETAARLAELHGWIERRDEEVADRQGIVQVWNVLQRALQDEEFEDPAKARKSADAERIVEARGEYYPALLAHMKRLLRDRVAEIDRSARHAEQARTLMRAIRMRETDTGKLAEHEEIVLHLAVNLGDISSRWAFIHGQDSHRVHATKDGVGRYAKMFQAIRNLVENLRESDPGAVASFEARTVDGLHNVRMFAPGLFAHAGSVAGTFGVANLSLMTPMDRRLRDGQPCDTVAALNAADMARAVGGIAPVLRALADSREMSLRSGISPMCYYGDTTFSNGKPGGASAKKYSGASPMPDRPARGGFVAVMRSATTTWEGSPAALTPAGFRPFSITHVNVRGRFEVPPLSRSYYGSALIVAAAFDDRGLINCINNQAKMKFGQPLTKAGCELFGAKSMTLVGLGYDRGATATQVMRAASTAPLSTKYSQVCENGNILSIYCKRTLEKVKIFNPAGMVFLGNTEDNPIVGDGVKIDAYRHYPTTGRAAADIQTLNKGRLGVLGDKRILEPSLQQLDVDAGDIRDRAAGLADTRVGAREGALAASAAVSRRAYVPLLTVFNDLVVAVVLLLLLSIPFAYSIERLLIGTPHIYRQIGWFGLFFLITFAVLYLVNPAFGIASEPIIIFLAFGIILLSSIVIAIMTRKLQTEVRRMQGLATTVHSADVSRLGTMLAAVHMGISTMRRRPVRTLLTAVTVVLLTFTILTFASFTSSWGNRHTNVGPMTGPARMIVRHPFWNRLREEVPESLEGFLADRATVVPRYWVAQSAQEVQSYKTANRVKQILLGDATGDRIVPITAVVGIDPRDVERSPDLAAKILGGRGDALKTDGVFLTPAVAGAEGLRLIEDGPTGERLKIGAPVWVDGIRCRFAGTLDRREVSRQKLLERSSMMPVDYEASSGSGQQTQQTTTDIQDLPEMESASFQHFSPDRVAIIPAELARRLGGRVAYITVYPKDKADVDRMANSVATITGLPTYVGSRGGVNRLFFTSLTEASGWRDLIIPVVLGGLIIFATMLGSVSDREKEIYAFSALGLAPPHVAGLFFAEAAVYAVVGGMGGYLLGQIVARTLSFVSETFGVLSVPTMNYSSTNAIVTVLVVMLTVMISTIYPALKASRSANPGIQRSWRIGRPAGDLYDIIFPFTVSAYDITGVVSFLQEHFQNYSDSTLGVFATSSSHVFRGSDEMLGISAEVALAPFDLGVAQRFALMAQPSEIEGIEEIRVLLRRTSGTRGDWQRANRVFVHELRKQLLIWRSVAPEVMDQYRQRTLDGWADLPVKDVHPETFGENP